MNTMAFTSSLTSSRAAIAHKPIRLPTRALAPRTSHRVHAAPDSKIASAELSFEPFEEVKGELVGVSEAPFNVSYARLDYHPECEAAVNEQINIEYTISYVYHSLYAYFDRDNIGLPGFAKYFQEASEEERGHAELLMTFQNKRGGRVQLHSLTAPEIEYDHEQKGEALYAMELTLSLERLNFMKLRLLHDVAAKHSDAEMTDFIEGRLLSDQAQSVKDAAERVSQLRRVGKGLGVYQFDLQLQELLEAA